MNRNIDKPKMAEIIYLEILNLKQINNINNIEAIELFIILKHIRRYLKISYQWLTI